MSHGRDKGCGCLLLVIVIACLSCAFCDTTEGRTVFVVVALVICALAGGGYHHHHPHCH